MNMYEEHAMTAIYMDAEMSHHGDPGSGDNTESYHPGLVIEQLNKVCSSRQQWLPFSRILPIFLASLTDAVHYLFVWSGNLAVNIMHMASMVGVADVLYGYRT